MVDHSGPRRRPTRAHLRQLDAQGPASPPLSGALEDSDPLPPATGTHDTTTPADPAVAPLSAFRISSGAGSLDVIAGELGRLGPGAWAKVIDLEVGSWIARNQRTPGGPPQITWQDLTGSGAEVPAAEATDLLYVLYDAQGAITQEPPPLTCHLPAGGWDHRPQPIHRHRRKRPSVKRSPTW